MDREQIRSTLEEEIAKRKSQYRAEVEAKRLADLNIIRRRNSRQTNGRSPLEVFPRELWTLILNKIRGDADIENARATCSLFREILEKRYFCEVLFPTILSTSPFMEILQRSGKNDHNDWEILLLRGVCKNWRDGFDNFCEQRLEEYGWNELDRSYPYMKQCLATFCLQIFLEESSVEVVDSILQNFSPDEADEVRAEKFFGRAISIYTKVSHPFVEFGNENRNGQRPFVFPVDMFHSLILTKVPQLLGIFGTQVLRFSFWLTLESYWECGLTLSSAFQELIRWIGKMPQLKWLKLGINIPNDIAKYEAEMEQVGTVLEEEPFPTLRDLHKLELCITGYSTATAQNRIFQAILDANKHVKDIDFKSATENLLQTFSFRELENLEYLSLGTAFVRRENLRQLFNPVWPLKRLKIQFNSEHRKTNMGQLLRFLENFQTLEWVHLELVEVEGEDPGFVHLPNVTQFTLHFGNALASVPNYDHNQSVRALLYSIDYLLPMNKLEYLQWSNLDVCWTQDYPADMAHPFRNDELWEYEIIRFRAGRTDLKRSNIWDLFPELKNVKIDVQSTGVTRRMAKG